VGCAGVVFAANQDVVDDLDAAGVDQTIGEGSRRAIRDPAAQLEAAAARTHLDRLGGKRGIGLERFAGPREGGRGDRARCRPAPLAGQQAADAGMAARAVEFAHEESNGEPGTEPEQGARQQLSTGVALNPPCDSELHSVNLIPSITPENRAEVMAKDSVTRGTLPMGRLVLLVLVVLAGLGLFLWLSRSTPIVVQPAGVEARP